MFGNRAQGMIVDLVLLILISGIFFMFLSNQLIKRGVDAGVVRAQSNYVQKLLISMLSYGNNSTIAEMISLDVCLNVYDEYLEQEIKENINYIINKLNKKGYYYIFTACTDMGCNIVLCDNEVKEKYGRCCIRTKEINLAKFKMELPCGGTLETTLGIWPKSMVVEPC